MHPHRQAVFCALGAVLAWSTVAAAFKYSLRWLTPVELLLVASLSSLLVLAGVLAVQGRLGHLRRLPARDWLASAGYGFLNPFLYYLVLFEAYRRLPAQVAQPLQQPRRGPPGDLCVHRRLVQHPAPALGARLPLTQRLRKEVSRRHGAPKR